MFNWSYNAGTIAVKINGSVFEEKSSCKMLGLSLSAEWSSWNSYIVFITKTAYKKIVALICLLTFFVLKVLFISKSLPFDLP